MSKIALSWDNGDKNVVRMTFKNWWTVDDYYVAFEQFGHMAGQQPHTVHCIADFSRSEGFLGHLLKDIPMLETYLPLNYGLCVIVDASYQVETMFSIAHRVAPTVFGSVRFANDLDEGRQRIHEEGYPRCAAAD